MTGSRVPSGTSRSAREVALIGLVGALRRAVLWALLPAVLLLVLAAAGAQQSGVDLGVLVREPTTLGGLAFYAGGLAAITVGLWTAAAAVALVSTLGRPRADPRLGRLLVGTGLLSLALAVDDQFRLHEDVLPAYGLVEPVVFGGYALVLAAALWQARAALLSRGDSAVLALALLLLAASLGVDLVQEQLEQTAGLSDGSRVFLEDGFKLCGAAVWLRWTALVSRDVHTHTGSAGGHG